jgi:hypothetical protein
MDDHIAVTAADDFKEEVALSINGLKILSVDTESTCVLSGMKNGSYRYFQLLGRWQTQRDWYVRGAASG